MLAPGDPRHGTHNGYANLRCRCEACRAANAEFYRAWMDQHPEARAAHNAQKRAHYHTKKRRAA
jgi:hypothetical protein